MTIYGSGQWLPWTQWVHEFLITISEISILHVRTGGLCMTWYAGNNDPRGRGLHYLSAQIKNPKPTHFCWLRPCLSVEISIQDPIYCPPRKDLHRCIHRELCRTWLVLVLGLWRKTGGHMIKNSSLVKSDEGCTALCCTVPVRSGSLLELSAWQIVPF